MRRKYLVIWYIYLGTKYPMGDGHNEIHFISYTADLLHNVENFELNLMMKMFKREKIIDFFFHERKNSQNIFSTQHFYEHTSKSTFQAFHSQKTTQHNFSCQNVRVENM